MKNYGQQKFNLLLVPLLLVSIHPLFAADKTNISIYQSGNALVRENRTLTLGRGVNTVSLSDLPSGIDSSSISADFDGSVIHQVYRNDLLNMESILSRYKGMEISLLGENFETIQGKLVSVRGREVILRDRYNGFLMIPDISRFRFTLPGNNSNLLEKPTVLWELESGKSGDVPLTLNYMTRGLNWQCQYQLFLDDDAKKMDLESWVDITNSSGLSYKEASLDLIAGKINRQGSPAPVMLKTESYRMAADSSSARINTEPVTEYYSYTLPGVFTLNDNEQSRHQFFSSKSISYREKFQYTGGKSVQYMITFDNTLRNSLGKALPAGLWQIYLNRNSGIVLLGEDISVHKALDTEIELKLGQSFDMSVEEVKTDFSRQAKNMTQETWEITFMNSAASDKNIEVIRYMPGDWDIISSNHEEEKLDSSRVIFNVKAAAGKKTVLTYTVKYTY